MQIGVERGPRQPRCYTRRAVSGFPRPALLTAVPVAVAIAALLFILAQQLSATASEAASTMTLEVSGEAVSCDAPDSPSKCSVEGGEEFTVAVAVDNLPADASGYIGFQSLLYYGAITYNPNPDVENEVVWPDSALPLRSPNNPGGLEGIVGHASVTSQTPPLEVSTYVGNVMQLRLVCSETQESFQLVLIGYDPEEQPLGSGFRLSEADGGVTVAAKVRGQAVLDLDGDPSTDAQTVDAAATVKINCSGPTPTPVPPNPDLIIQGMSVTLETGGACNYTTTTLGIRIGIANAGNVDAGPFVLDVNGIQQTIDDGLAVDEKLSLWFAGFSSGENTAFVDATMQVDEMSELNNEVSQILPVPTLPQPCTPTPAPTLTPVPVPVPGDVDCNGTVTAIDAALLLQLIAALTDTLPCEHNADVNSNAAIDAIDVTLILQFSAGLLASL